jgi:hypothetical protein
MTPLTFAEPIALGGSRSSPGRVQTSLQIDLFSPPRSAPGLALHRTNRTFGTFTRRERRVADWRRLLPIRQQNEPDCADARDTSTCERARGWAPFLLRCAWQASPDAGGSAERPPFPYRPVTPEVAGSSPVAPAENILQIGVFCCLTRRGDRRLLRKSRANPVDEKSACVQALSPPAAGARVCHPARRSPEPQKRPKKGEDHCLGCDLKRLSRDRAPPRHGGLDDVKAATSPVVSNLDRRLVHCISTSWRKHTTAAGSLSRDTLRSTKRRTSGGSLPVVNGTCDP